jgi:hypothetical protein
VLRPLTALLRIEHLFGFCSIDTFVCSEFGEGVVLDRPAQ